MLKEDWVTQTKSASELTEASLTARDIWETFRFLLESKDATLNPFQGGSNTGSTKAREETIHFMNACKSKL